MIFGKRSGSQGAAADTVHTQYNSSQVSGEGVEAEYEELVRLQLAKLGVPLDTVSVEVRPAGEMEDGRAVYLGMVRLTAWEARTSLRLLMALPLLEAKTRQALETMWLTDVSHFGGLWVHASSSLRTTEVMVDIREAIMRLEMATRATNRQEPSHAGWSASVQAELEDPTSGRSDR